MSIYRDRNGYIRDGVLIGTWIGGVVLAIAIIVAIGIAGTIHSQHVECLRLHEATGKATTMRASGLDQECYIKVGSNWIPADRYRGVTVDGQR